MLVGPGWAVSLFSSLLLLLLLFIVVVVVVIVVVFVVLQREGYLVTVGPRWRGLPKCLCSDFFQ